jgi:hypothetical protein
MSEPRDNFFKRTLRRLGILATSDVPSPVSDEKKAIDEESSNSETDDAHDDEQRTISRHIAKVNVEKRVTGDTPGVATTTSPTSTSAILTDSPNPSPLPSLIPDDWSPPADHLALKNPNLPAHVARQLVANKDTVTIPGSEVAELTETAQKAWNSGFWPDGTPADRERRWSGGEPGDGIGGVGGGGGCG